MKLSMLSPVVAGALREAMHERLVINHAKETLCDWCQRPFEDEKPRYLMDGAMYCTKGCMALDQEDA